MSHTPGPPRSSVSEGGDGGTAVAGSLRSPVPNIEIYGTENPPLRRRVGVPLLLPYRITGSTTYWAPESVVVPFPPLAPPQRGRRETHPCTRSEVGRPVASYGSQDVRAG